MPNSFREILHLADFREPSYSWNMLAQWDNSCLCAEASATTDDQV